MTPEEYMQNKFATALSHGVRNPKISLFDGDYNRVIFKLGQYSAINILYGVQSVAVGTIKNGQIEIYLHIDDYTRQQVTAVIYDFSHNPLQSTRLYAQLQHACCFCNKSFRQNAKFGMEVGYGVHCGSYWNMPHTKKELTDYATRDMFANMDTAKNEADIPYMELDLRSD